MQIVRTIVWVLMLIVFVAFTVLNWDKELTVRIWSGMVWDTRLPAVVVVSFLLGLVPMWLIHRGSKWRLQRRVVTLESAARTQAITPTASSVAEPLAPDAPVEAAPLRRDDIAG